MAWTLYKEIKYATDGIPAENLTDFPKLVFVDADSDIASELSSGGGVKFTSADGMTDLSFGLYPSTDLSAGTVLARVKLSLLTAASVGDVMCRLYYSADESTTEDKAGTVGNDYQLFMPLEEDPSGSAPQMYDWVDESNRGTSAGSMASGDLVAGTVGNQLDFDGSDDTIAGTMASANSGNAFTVEIIAAITGTDLEGLWKMSDNASQAYADKRSGFSPDNIVLGVRQGFGGPALNVNVDIDEDVHSWAFRYNGSDMSIFKDGVSIGSSSISFTLPTTENNFEIAPSIFARGQMQVDEFAISTVYRSSNWLAYSHTDNFDNADTFTLGTEQGGSSGIEVSVSPVVAEFSVVAPSVAKSLAVSPLAAEFSVVSPGIGKSLAVDPVAAEFSLVAPALAKSIAVDPVELEITVVSIGLGITIAVAPVVAEFSIIAPSVAKSLAVSPISAEFSVISPSLGKSLAIDPVAAEITIVAPDIGKSIAVDPVAAEFTVVSVGLAKSITFDPLVAELSVVAVTTTGGGGAVIVSPPWCLAEWAVVQPIAVEGAVLQPISVEGAALQPISVEGAVICPS